MAPAKSQTVSNTFQIRAGPLESFEARECHGQRGEFAKPQMTATALLE